MDYLDTIRSIDFFGKSPELYIKGKPKQITIVGRIFTLIFIFLYAMIVVYKFFRMISRIDITFYDSYITTDNTPSFKINNENFYLLFSLFDENGEPFINETIYYPTAYFFDGEREEIKLEKCNINKIGSEYKKYFSDFELNNFYCLNDVNYILYPYGNSIHIQLFPCKNNTENNNHCQSKEIIDKQINGKDFIISFKDILVTPFNYSYPIKERINSLYTTVFKNYGQFMYTEMEIVNIETSTNIIGFDFLTSPKVEEFIKYDSLEIIPQPGYDLDEEENDYAICEIEFQLNDKILTEKKQYIQLLDILGEVGGLMEFTFSLFNFICNFLGDSIYEKSLIKNLFSYDIKNKIIFLKPKQKITTQNVEEQIKDESELRKSPTIYIYKTNRKKNMSINEDVKNINSRNSENFLIKKNNILKYYDKEEKINENNLNNLNKINDNNKSLTIYNYSNTNRKNLNNITASSCKNITIDKIDLKTLLMAKFFCLKKSKKNIYKILLNETMDIISKKLDIYNIFRMLFIIEENTNNLENISNIIKMSKDASNELSEIT